MKHVLLTYYSLKNESITKFNYGPEYEGEDDSKPNKPPVLRYEYYTAPYEHLYDPTKPVDLSWTEDSMVSTILPPFFPFTFYPAGTQLHVPGSL